MGRKVTLNEMINMHPQDVEIQIRKLVGVNSYRSAEAILIELKNYSGKLTPDQLSRICFTAITNEQIYKCFNCKNHLKVIFKKNEENLDKSQYESVLKKFNE